MTGMKIIIASAAAALMLSTPVFAQSNGQTTIGVTNDAPAGNTGIPPNANAGTIPGTATVGNDTPTGSPTPGGGTATGGKVGGKMKSGGG